MGILDVAITSPSDNSAVIAAYVAAVVALVVGLVPPWLLWADRRRTRRLVAMSLANEVFTVRLRAAVAKMLLSPVVAGDLRGNTYNEARDNLEQLSVPLIEKYLDKIDVLPDETASWVIQLHGTIVLQLSTKDSVPRLTDPIEGVAEVLRERLYASATLLSRVADRAHARLTSDCGMPTQDNVIRETLRSVAAERRPDLVISLL
jgi:hypothetical protein